MPDPDFGSPVDGPSSPSVRKIARRQHAPLPEAPLLVAAKPKPLAARKRSSRVAQCPDPTEPSTPSNPSVPAFDHGLTRPTPERRAVPEAMQEDFPWSWRQNMNCHLLNHLDKSPGF